MTQHVYLFQPRFAPLVESGKKRQTVRPMRKRMPDVGDIASLRAWTGQPYRSKQRLLLTARIIGVRRVRIVYDELFLSGARCTPAIREIFAQKDGFDNWDSMRAWFYLNHGGDTFDGFLTEWLWTEESRP